ncbi:MAG: AI-2E family transporter [Pseudonocardiales bacterium]|nr:MAG: AI-2E family transporter [Pseudonocardiales bacterium]
MVDRTGSSWRTMLRRRLRAAVAPGRAEPAEAAPTAQSNEVAEGEARTTQRAATAAGASEDSPYGRLGRPIHPRSPFRMGFIGAIGAGLVYLLYKALVVAESVLILVVVAAFLAIGLNPLVSWLERHSVRRGLAVGIVFIGALVFLGGFGYAVVPPIGHQVSQFIRELPDYVSRLRNNRTVARLDAKWHFINRLKSYASSGVGTTVATGVVGFGKAVASAIFNTVTVLILTLYFLSSFNQIKNTAFNLVPKSRRPRVVLLGNEILSRVGGYVGGAFVIALIAGGTSLLWLFLLGVPYPLALALIVTITDVIPLVGASIGAVIATTTAFFVSVPVGIGTAAFYLVYQQVENYFIYPRVMKRAVDVNPAAAIVGVLVGGAVFGVVGALLAIPTTAAIALILREVVTPRLDQR